MPLLITILNILLSSYGLYRAYKRKNLVFFFWMIICYYSITSLVSLYSYDNKFWHESTKLIYSYNMMICLISFILSDICFNKKIFPVISWESIFQGKMRIPHTYFELIYWVAIIGTFVELRSLSYNAYNTSTGAGAGWFQVLFQSFSCVLFYFIYKRDWIKIILASILIILIIAAIGVRSLLYFVLLPIALFFIYNILYSSKNLSHLVRKFIPLIIVAFIAVLIVNTLRFGRMSLPEVELTSISLQVIEEGNYPPQTINSALHYLAHLSDPIINALNLFGFDYIPLSDYLPPSIPRLNAVITQQVPDVSYLQNASHMPGTIFHDLFLSWGNWAPLFAFILYLFFLKVCSTMQNNPLLFYAFSGIFGWHFYMLLRGAVDSSTGGLSYSIWICLFIYMYLKWYQKRRI